MATLFRWIISLGEWLKGKSKSKKLCYLCMNPAAIPEAIEALLNAGANIEAKDHQGSTPVMWAARWNKNPEVIEVLLKAGAYSRARGEWFTPRPADWPCGGAAGARFRVGFRLRRDAAGSAERDRRGSAGRGSPARA